MYTILGAGLAGLSCSYHLGHQQCVVFEAAPDLGGHIRTVSRNGFNWDEGPHVSFTNDGYVRSLFESSAGDCGVNEFPSIVTNYADGAWIPHPAQSNLACVPQPIRDLVYEDFLLSRDAPEDRESEAIYKGWLISAFGESFAKIFPARYTRKYWTVDPSLLSSDWVGDRVFKPDVENVKRGYAGTLQNTHYIQSVRYPNKGGFSTFANEFTKNINVNTNHTAERIDLQKKLIYFANGLIHPYEKLISTVPLPRLVQLCQAPAEVQDAANALACTSLLLVNVTANHVPKRDFHWMYVYNEDFLSTRITSIGSLAKANVPEGKLGLQVEIYGSAEKELPEPQEAMDRVSAELIKMGLVDAIETIHCQFVPYANVIFDLKRRKAQNLVLSWLASHGLDRVEGDLDPMTDWSKKSPKLAGNLFLAGRFGQWKYFWTDDCVLRGKQLKEALDCQENSELN